MHIKEFFRRQGTNLSIQFHATANGLCRRALRAAEQGLVEVKGKLTLSGTASATATSWPAGEHRPSSSGLDCSVSCLAEQVSSPRTLIRGLPTKRDFCGAKL